MVEYSFGANSNSATNKIAEFMKSFEPKINFEIEDSHFGKLINCKFKSEDERDSFIQTIIESLGISEGGTYTG